MMINQKLISFDLKADFGFLKKPDINDGLYLTYNMLHKPALIGILGSIIGLQGYQENRKFPEYYIKLKHLKIGIKPIGSEKGNFLKDILAYNNSIGFASAELGGNLIIKEQILINPSYRCYLLLDLNNEDERLLYDRLFCHCAEFIPYLGKNEFSAWWDNVKEYDYEEFDFMSNYKIESAFSKTDSVSNYMIKSIGRCERLGESSWFYFEKLPIGFDEKLYQYSYGDFVLSNAMFSKEMNMSEAGKFYKINNETIIQLF